MEEQLTPWEMQCKLNSMGYDMEYLDTLQNSAIERMYKTEYLGESEE
jgi:hypothetical protein